MVFLRNIFYFAIFFALEIFIWDLMHYEYYVFVPLFFACLNILVLAVFHIYSREKQSTKQAEVFSNLFINNDIIWELNSEGNIFKNIHAKSEKLLGYTLQDWLSSDFLSTNIFDADKDLVLNSFYEIANQEVQKNFTFRFYNKNRDLIWLENKVVQIQRKPIRVFGTLTDITAEKKKELLLQFHSDILNKMSEGVFLLKTSDASIIYTNPSFDKLFGYEAGELIGRHVSILNSSDMKPSKEVADEINSILYKDGSWRGEVHNQKKNGEAFWCDVNVSEYLHPELGLVWISVHNDITHRKKIEYDLMQAKQIADEANNAKTEFLARMSHEIRTPLNSILGITSLLLHSDISPEMKTYLEVAVKGIDILESLISTITDFSMIESNNIIIDEKEENLMDLIQSLYAVFKPKADEKELEFIIDVDSQLPNLLIFDPHKLRQILISLISNAIKFTTTGNLALHAKLINIQVDTIDVEFKVIDTGVGIKEEYQSRVFEKYFQADSSITRKFGGSGLGLSFCKKLVEILNGKIWFQTEEGKGSTFFIHLQFKLPANTNYSTESKPSITHDESLISIRNKNARILIVDDDKINAMVAIHILKNRGILNVKHALSGIEALKILENSIFDLVLMDIRMPEMDGVESTVLIRKRSNIPIVAITGEAMEGEKERCFAAGMNDFYTKPISAPKLISILNEWT